MKVDDSSYSRLKLAHAPRPVPKPTRTQKAMEVGLFVVFGFIIALAGVALYATNRPEHQLVPNRVAAGVTADRVNVLLIGSSILPRNAGDAIRVESVMLLSVQPSSGRAALMSIPGDLFVKVGRYGPRPLRAAHSVGDASGYPGAGIGLTVDTVEAAIGQPVHAFARFTIGDVQRLVDAVGGIDVDVHQGVYDYRYKTRFRRGAHRLDGTEAMRYAYSSSVAGPAAANRFARQERQQQVILAAVAKALDENNALQLQRIFGPRSVTNLTRDDAAVILGVLRQSSDIQPVTFAPYVEAFDVASVTYRGEAVRPLGGNFGTLRHAAEAVFDVGVARVH